MVSPELLQENYVWCPRNSCPRNSCPRNSQENYVWCPRNSYNITPHVVIPQTISKDRWRVKRRTSRRSRPTSSGDTIEFRGHHTQFPGSVPMN